MQDQSYIPSFELFSAEQDAEAARLVQQEAIKKRDAIAAQIPKFSEFQPEPTARDEAIAQAVPGLPQDKIAKFKQSRAAKQIEHQLPPDVPTRSTDLIDQRAAQFEVLKAGGALEKLTPQQRAEFTAPLQAAGWEVGDGYIKPPAAQPGAYPLWEYQLAGGPQIPERKSIGAQLKETGEGVVGFAKGIGELAADALTGKALGATRKAYQLFAEPQLNEFKKARELAREKGYKDGRAVLADPEIAGHFVAAFLPFIGPQAAAAGEQIGKGENVSGALNAIMALGPSVAKGIKARGKLGGAQGMKNLESLIKEVDNAETMRPETTKEVIKQEVLPDDTQRVPVNTGGDTVTRVEETKGQIPETSTPAEAPKAQAKVGERSLPKTLDAAKLAKGTDLTYDVASNPATVEAARKNVAEKGIDGAIEFVKSSEPSAEHTATGFAVIRELQDAGDFAKAAEVASDLSANLTAHGQAIQAVKTIADFAPEKAVVTAQKVLDQTGKGKKLNSIQTERITKAAKAIEKTGEDLAKVEKRLDEMSAKLPATSPANWRAKLIGAEEAARARLAERVGKKLGPEAGEAPIIADLADLAIVGAAKLARKGIDFGTWSAEMLSEFGDTIKPHLAKIYRASFEQYSGAKRDSYQAMKERAVQKGLPPMTAQELAAAVQQRDLAIKARTAATRGLAREYEALKPGARLKRELVSAINLPRALKASLDLSAPLRQGAIFLPEVKASGKAFAAQIKSLTERGFEKVYQDIQRNPEFKEAQASGVEFTGEPLRGTTKLNAAEEAFMTRWADKIPGIKQSNQAYSGYLDTLRMNVFEKYSKQIKQAVTDPKMQAAELKHWASFVNKATGRGDLGRGGNAIAPVLNSVFFSPRYAVSRLQILNPGTYMKMTPFARKTAMRKMFQFTGMVGTTLALAKAAGLEVSTDPTAADFLKIKAGDTRFDILAGLQQWMRFGARLSAGFYKSANGEKLKPNETPETVVKQFARSKASPPASIVWDYATGRTFEGEQPTLKGELEDQFIPLFLKDAFETWKSESPTPTKAVATGASFFGVGVSTYKPKTPRKPPTKDPQKELRKLLGLE